MNKFIASVILLMLASTAQAEVYFEFGLETGGLEPLTITSSGEAIYPGGGYKLALGVQYEVGEHRDFLSFSLGRIGDIIYTSNGTAKIDTFIFDAIYSIPIDRHRFGLGASFHIGPTYEDNISGNSPVKIKFDDAFGLILHYSYTLNSGFQLGARYTPLMEYEADGLSRDASSFGFFLSNGF